MLRTDHQKTGDRVRTRVRRRGAALAGGLALLVAIPAGAAAAGTGPSRPASLQPGPSTTSSATAPTTRVIVKYRSSVSQSGRLRALSAGGLRVRRTLALTGATVVDVPKGRTAQDVVADLRDDPDVEYAVPDVLRRPLAGTGQPNDPFFSQQWGLRNTGQPLLPSANAPRPRAGVDVGALAAWSLSTTSSPVTVAVIDDAAQLTHADLQGALSSIPGRDFTGATTSTAPAHGTHVSGIIAADRDNDRGVAGLASGVAQLLPLKFMTVDANGDEQGYDSDAIAAIGYATSVGAKVINASWGASSPDGSAAANPALRDAISQCDCVFVAASGNDGLSTNSVANRVYPAAFDLPNLISVAAAGVDGNLADFSNHGWTTAVAAPGDAILSTLPCPTSNGTPDDCYGWGAGTSMAAPFVSATAALMLSRQPSLTPAQIVSTIKATVRVTGSLDVTTGGMVDAAAAMRQVSSTVPVPTRLGGRDRYVTASEVAKQFAPGVPVVYVASGEGFADALAGAALAASQHVPLVLTASKSVPIATVSALSRLKPQRIVVLGGTASVSDAVKTRLQSYTTGSVTRLEGNAQEGKDRYGTAAAVARTLNAGAGETDTVYVASGQDFPDALSAAAVAGANGEPVLLTKRDTLPASTRLRLAGLGPKHIVVLGGTGAVSADVADALQLYAPVERVGGADRYATSALVAARLSTATSAYVANGTGFADALAGAALAGSRGAPVVLVKRDSVPDAAAQQLAAMSLQEIVELGGTGSISPANVVTLGDRFVR